MRIHRSAQRQRSIEGAQRAERPLRLATGLILFAYATSHFLNHAFGIRSIDAMRAASAILLAPWQTYFGLLGLYISFLVHGLLGLYALYRRRHLRLPAGEAWQLALGLTIPLLLILHAGAIRLGGSIYGQEFGYERILYNFWVVSPDIALPRQLLLLLIVWIHGCIGLRAWLRTKPWYHRIAGVLAALATLVPVLAILGLSMRGSIFATRRCTIRPIELPLLHRPAVKRRKCRHGGPDHRRHHDLLSRFGDRNVWPARGARLARQALSRHPYHLSRTPCRFRAVGLLRSGSKPVGRHSACVGLRWPWPLLDLQSPHCAGRAGARAPGPVERLTLRRIGAPPPVRLACQLRPSADISVEPLVPIGEDSASGAARFDAAVEGGRELEIAAMFVDLRGSTSLATDRLPYDALFLFDRYIQAVTGAVRRNKGHATSIAGDGVMSVFGVDGTAALAARNAFQAALDVWSGLEVLSEQLAGELEAPLRVGIGIHFGMAVVGLVSTSESQSLQFLGDTGNIAAKLEAQSKHLDCTLVASVAALNSIGPDMTHIATSAVAIAGTTDPVKVAVFRHKSELKRILSSLQDI
jgi:adenylate cyclase